MWIDIENASGERRGPGPITTAMSWRSVRRLDAAGEFAFSMPAGDARAAYLAHKRVVRCWTSERGVLREIGAGVIDEISVRPQAGGRAVLEVSGGDLLTELANIQVGDLELFDRNEYEPDLIEYVVTVGTGYTVTLPATIDLSPAVPGPDNLTYLFVSHDEQFDKLRFRFGTPVNGQVCDLKMQYFNGETLGWENLNFEDGTAAGGAPWRQDGVISWFLPPAWTPYGTPARYIMRFYQDEVNLDAVRINEIVIDRNEPTGAALARTMALAPTPWELDAEEGELQTSQPVYLQMAGETVLATLARLAEQTGDHFALGVDGRTVRWLGSRQDRSGMRAIAPAAAGGLLDTGVGDYVLQIVALDEARTSYDLATRVYPAGAGLAGERLTLADLSGGVSLPGGYTYSDTDNYVQRTAAAATYGRIDRVMEFPDITPVDSTPQALDLAARELLTRTIEQLRRISELQRVYRLQLAPAAYDVWPGQLLRVVYHEWTDGFHAVNIDQVLWILETETAVDQNGGRRLIGLTVATVDKLPTSDASLMMDVLAKGEVSRRQRLARASLTDAAAGVPVVLSVTDGLVSEVRRVTPAGDGRYVSPTAITIRNGIVTDVET